MIYVYLIDGKRVAVAASSSTVAKYGLSQRYPNVSTRFIGVIDDFFQVNGNMDIDGECKVISEENVIKEAPQNEPTPPPEVQ